MNIFSSFTPNIILLKKKAVLIIMLLLFTCLLSVRDSCIIHANNNYQLHTFNEYSVNVPDSFTVDSKTLQDFTSFYGDDITIGIRVTDNTVGENVTTLTESEISEITTDTLSSLMAQAGEGITVKEHFITTLSDRAYPSLYIAFAGSSDIDADVYIEEYIITTVSYKYTIVFSADNKERLQSDDVNQFKNSFTTTEAPLKQVIPADRGSLNIVLGICVTAVVVFLIVTVLIVRRQSVRRH